MNPCRRVDIGQHRSKLGPPLRVLDVGPDVHHSHDPRLGGILYRLLRRDLEPQKVRVRVHEHSAHPLFPRDISEGHYKGIGLQVSGFKGWAAEAPSVLYQPLVDLATTVSRLTGRLLGRPRRTLSFCHVGPRLLDYGV